MKAEFKQNIKTYAPYIIGGVGLYLVYKFFFKKSATEQTSQNVVDAQTQYINNLSKTLTPSYNLSYYGSLANQIYNTIAYSGAADNYTNTFQLMLKVLNQLDMALLIKAYGVRQRYFFGLPAGYPEDLITSVSNELRSEIIANPFSSKKYELLNKWFSENNIKERL
jgi:hypothetical protein